MDYTYSNTTDEIRKKGKHLTLDERGKIEILHKQKKSLRYIASEIGCSASTILYELQRGIIPHACGRGRKPVYKAGRGQQTYLKHRVSCHRKHKLCDPKFQEFVDWVKCNVKEKGWSLDSCAGYAKVNHMFGGAIVCTKTLYNMLGSNEFPICPLDLPQVVKRRNNTVRHPVKNKRLYGRSIDERPAEIAQRKVFGHWEGDTVVGKKAKGPVIFVLSGFVSKQYIALKIPGKTTEGVRYAMLQLKKLYGDKFSEVFKSITFDNGSEFAEAAQFEEWGTKIYYAHPYSAWERGRNESHNRLLRQYVPKGKSINDYSEEEIMSFADIINSVPRRSLDYKTAEEIFEEYLDQIYST